MTEGRGSGARGGSGGGNAKGKDRAALLLLAGVVILAQFLLYGASLTGQRILLPLDLLAVRGEVGTDPRLAGPYQSRALGDLIDVIEPWRSFTASEVRAGRLPLWNPWNYCGAPFLAAGQPAVFSPYRLVDYAWPAPAAIAWAELAQALVGAFGAYVLFRRALGVASARALAGACVFPQIGFFVLWQGFPLTRVASLLPWLLVAVHAVVARPGPLSAAALAVATALLLLAGHLPFAGLCLLASAAWLAACVLLRFGPGELRSGAVRAALLAGLAGWGAGILLSAPQTLPSLEYMASSRRLAVSAWDPGELTPIALSSLPQALLINYHGSTRIPSVYTGGPLVQLEGPGMAWAGLLAALVAAPLAFAAGAAGSRRMAWIWTGAIGVGLIGAVVPPLLTVVEHTPLRLLSLHRLPLFGGLGILVLAVMGLEAVGAGAAAAVSWKRAALPMAALAALGLRCALQAGTRSWAPAGAGPERIAATQALHALSAAFCLAGLILWGLLVLRPRWASAGLLGGLLALESVAMAHGAATQCDPRLYYPLDARVKALAEGTSYRATGLDCLHPNLSMKYGLRDVRGYDGVDPRRIIELVDLSRKPGAPAASYAALYGYTPVPGPITDLLSIRHAVMRKEPGSREAPVEVELFVRSALPRVSVPRRIEALAEGASCLERLADPAFDPREVAFVEGVSSPPIAEARGSAVFLEDLPARQVIEARLETRACVLVSDSWDRGWRASVDGHPARVLRANHALRAIEADAGVHRIELTYWPASLSAGLVAAALAAAGLVAACILRRNR